MRISDWGSDVCSSDLAGVAGGALDDDAAGPQRATLLGILDDRPGGAVLHRATGILELGLAEDLAAGLLGQLARSEEHTSELQSLMRISYAVFCLKKKNYNINRKTRLHEQITNYA